jgi:hypothetical protein
MKIHTSVTLAGVCLLAAATASGACLAFQAGPRANSFVTPHTVLPIDLNGDGKVDVASVGTDFVALHLGHGDGSFDSPGKMVPVATGGFSVGTGDLNRDGRTDLVTATYYDGVLTVLLNQGDGNVVAKDHRTVEYVWAVRVADVTGEGNPDVLLGTSAGLVVFKGDGTGGISSQPLRTIHQGSPILAFLPGDFDGDGRIDIVANFVEELSLTTLRGNGDGTFVEGPTIASGGARAISSADFDGDGRADIALGSASDSSLQIFLGNGDGSFRRVKKNIPLGIGTWTVAPADFTGDGKPDLVVSDQYERGLSVFVGVGDGTFTGPTIVGKTYEAYGIAAVDVNGDRRPDILYGDYTKDAFGILRNAGDCGGAVVTKRRSVAH